MKPAAPVRPERSLQLPVELVIAPPVITWLMGRLVVERTGSHPHPAMPSLFSIATSQKLIT